MDDRSLAGIELRAWLSGSNRYVVTNDVFPFTTVLPRQTTLYPRPISTWPVFAVICKWSQRSVNQVKGQKIIVACWRRLGRLGYLDSVQNSARFHPTCHVYCVTPDIVLGFLRSDNASYHWPMAETFGKNHIIYLVRALTLSKKSLHRVWMPVSQSCIFKVASY